MPINKLNLGFSLTGREGVMTKNQKSEVVKFLKNKNDQLFNAMINGPFFSKTNKKYIFVKKFTKFKFLIFCHDSFPAYRFSFFT